MSLVSLVGSTVAVSWQSESTGTATLVVTDPNGDVVSTSSVTDTGTTHAADFTAVLPGRHALLWASDAGERFADVVDVWPENPRYLVSVSDLDYRLRKNNSRQLVGDLRDAMQLNIATATWVIESIVGPVLPTQEVYATSGSPRKRAVVLPHVGVTVERVDVDGGTLDPSQYKVDTRAGVIYSDALTAGDVNIEVTYSKGKGEIPPPARQACIELAEHLFEIAHYGAQSNEAGGEVVETSTGFALPRRVLQLLSQIPSAPGIA